MAGCGPNFIYEQEQAVEENTWEYAQPVQFPFDISDTLALYNLYLDVEHNTSYPFQNMYVQMHTTQPSGKKISDIVSLELADKAGVWHGNCGGEWCDLRIHIQKNAYFNEVGTYQLTINPYMRQDSLPVRSLALRIEDTEQKR